MNECYLVTASRTNAPQKPAAALLDYQFMLRRDFPFHYEACKAHCPQQLSEDMSAIYWESSYKTLMDLTYKDVDPAVKQFFLHALTENIEAIKGAFSENYRAYGYPRPLTTHDVFKTNRAITNIKYGKTHRMDVIEICLKTRRAAVLDELFRLIQHSNTLPEDFGKYAVAFNQSNALHQYIRSQEGVEKYISHHGLELTHVAAKYNLASIIWELWNYYGAWMTPSSSFNPLHTAAQKGHLEAVQMLVQQGFDIDYQNETHSTALTVATIQNHVVVVDYLLSQGANPNLITHPASSKTITPLHAACLNGNKAALLILLHYHANPNVSVRAEKITPLCTAIDEGNLELAQILIEHKANVNQLSFGETPLMRAIHKNNLAIVKLILETGGCPLTSGNQKYTPLALAQSCNSASIASFLEKFIKYQNYRTRDKTPYHDILQMLKGYCGYSTSIFPFSGLFNRIKEEIWNPSHPKLIHELLSKKQYQAFDEDALLSFFSELKDTLKSIKIKEDGDLAVILSHIKIATGMDYFHLPHPPEEEPEAQPEEAALLYPDLSGFSLNTFFEQFSPSAPPEEEPCPAPPPSPENPFIKEIPYTPTHSF